MSPILVVGMGLAGGSVAARLTARGCQVIASDDRPSDSARGRAERGGAELHEAPSVAELTALVERAAYVVPSPGVPDAHPVFEIARERKRGILSEFDLARHWDDRPMVAVTGTNGKTTVTTMIAQMLGASGIEARLAGNTELPLVDAIADETVEWFVVEASSFRLGHSRRFTPAVALWLNFAPDHLDVHASLDRYEAAKATIFRDQTSADIAIVNLADPTVARNRPSVPQVVSFGAADADYREVDGVLFAGTEALIRVDELPRGLPHDRTNALAAAAAARAAGATLAAVREVLVSFRGLAHRLQLVAEHDDIRWYDDSKATTPHATLAAIAGFDDAVLIAGGQNKGIDLTPLSELEPRLRGVVAIGEAADEVAEAFSGRVPVRQASSMAGAVRAAAAMAQPGGAVVLSPACASFDWYANYGARGDDFCDSVRRLMEER